jgi:epsilon-lactone hydrolase
MYLPLGLINFYLRIVEKQRLRRGRNVVKVRKTFKRQALWSFPSPPNVTYLPDVLEHLDLKVPALWANGAGPKRDGVILFFHGGAYVMGAPDTHRAMLARLSELTGLRAVLPDYRLAPEHPFPAAVEDARAAYCALIERGYTPDQIVLGGDSAGGGLMLGLLHVICSEGLPTPGAVFAFSPWADQTLSGQSIAENAARDAVLPADRMSDLRDMYLGDADPNDPRASPIFGDFKGAPPVLIQVGDGEILLDDSRQMAEVLRGQNVEVKLDIWKNTPHVWQLFQGLLREGDQALEAVADFLNETLP